MDRGMDDDGAGAHLVAGVVERTAGRDEYPEEVMIARVQRAVAGVKAMRPVRAEAEHD
jgi:hypothetical protein